MNVSNPRSTSRVFSLPFVVVLAILAPAAIALNAATQAMKLHFKKQPVPLRADLDDPVNGVARQLGPWVSVREDVLGAEMRDALGTDKYVFRLYADTRIVPKTIVADLDAADESARKSAEQRGDDLRAANDKGKVARAAALQKLMTTKPEAFVTVALTYYTGSADTVPHIPDRCYVASGYQPTSREWTQWPIGGNSVPVRVMNFDDITAQGRMTRNVSYLFHVNGVYECDPLKVRQRLQNLFHRYGYFAKIELMTLLKDGQQAQAVQKDFLGAALPSVESCLPNFEEYARKD